MAKIKQYPRILTGSAQLTWICANCRRANNKYQLTCFCSYNLNLDNVEEAMNRADNEANKKYIE